jgi:phage gp36-like protein
MGRATLKKLMAYLTQEQLLAALDKDYIAQLADDNSGTNILAVVTGEEEGAVIIDEVIEDSSALVDLYLAVQYAVPISPTPRGVSRLAIKIAVFMLHERRHWTINDKLQSSYDGAVKMLEAIRDGELLIPNMAYVTRGSQGADDLEYTHDNLRLF